MIDEVKKQQIMLDLNTPMTVLDICKKHGVSESYVYSQLKPKRRAGDKVYIEAACVQVGMYMSQSLTALQIHQKMDVSIGLVYYYMKKNGYIPRPKGSIKELIKDLLSEGLSDSEMASRVGIGLNYCKKLIRQIYKEE